MTRRDYELIAGAIHRARPLTSSIDAHAMWRRCIDEMALALYVDNPRFDRSKFIHYCNHGRYT